ncbi:MAG: RsmE family RNA methyltransferase [Tunicatimonas sp.]
MPLFYHPALDLTDPALSPDESRHGVQVLRLRAGDPLTVVDGRGTYYEAVVKEANAKRCTLAIERTRREDSRPHRIHLAVAPTKNIDRTEWLVEKAVEVGVDQLSFVVTAHSERRVLKTERLMKKAVAAMKQAGRATLPTINDIQTLSAFLKRPTEAQRFIAYVEANSNIHLKQLARPTGSYVVLVGPEGGFSPAEVAQAEQSDYRPVSLGSYRLRTETAGLVAALTLNLLNE